MKPITRFILFSTCALLSALKVSGIPLSNREGKVIEVELLQIESTRVQIRMANGHTLWYDRARLSDESQAQLDQPTEAENDRFAPINTLLGINLLSDARLWDDRPLDIAQRLNWPLESQTATQSSYRSYPPADARILNCRPYSAVLYGGKDHAQHISIVFANKGDFPFGLLPSDDEIKQMERSIKADQQAIAEALTKQFGEPQRQQFGSGRGIKQLIERWNWNGHAFLLASQDGEFVNLKIMSTADADNKGRAEKLSDAALRELTTDNIRNRANGDVIIDNIPMVDQGPKGYCVPATFERYLRYMQIPADMYLLAMAGQTEVGGGTSLSRIIESIESYISSQSRSMKELREPMKVRTVQKYIDKGLPIIWTLYSSSEYNQYANQRTKERTAVSDWAVWEKTVKSSARATELRKDRMAAHACLIIGYNKETDEIAVSDSWGPSYNERWISAEQAEQVSQGSIYVIGF